MKQIKFLFMLLATFAFFTSCDEDSTDISQINTTQDNGFVASNSFTITTNSTFESHKEIVTIDGHTGLINIGLDREENVTKIDFSNELSPIFDRISTDTFTTDGEGKRLKRCIADCNEGENRASCKAGCVIREIIRILPFSAEGYTASNEFELSNYQSSTVAKTEYSQIKIVTLGNQTGVVYFGFDKEDNFTTIKYSNELKPFFEKVSSHQEIRTMGEHRDCMKGCREIPRGEGRGSCKADCWVDTIIRICGIICGPIID